MTLDSGFLRLSLTIDHIFSIFAVLQGPVMWSLSPGLDFVWNAVNNAVAKG